jgi:alpha-L-rhamnosidase
VAEALNRPAGEVALQRRRQSALTAAVNRHLTRSDGTYVDGRMADGTPTQEASQTANACAAFYEVVPAAHLAGVARYVSSLGMQAPVQTAAEVLGTLAQAGLYDDLVARLTDSTSDGWANILARGATFTWEVWNPSDVIGDSMSHGWGSNVLVQIQRSLLGVRPTGPGFATFEVSPPTGGLAAARGSVPTPRGAISVAWSRPPASHPPFSVEVTVPPNSTAQVRVPGRTVRAITEGGRAIDRASGIRLLGMAGGVARLELGAGSYRIASSSTGP